MKYFQATRFIILSIVVLFIGAYHTIEMNHGLESTREERGYYGPAY